MGSLEAMNFPTLTMKSRRNTNKGNWQGPKKFLNFWQLTSRGLPILVMIRKTFLSRVIKMDSDKRHCFSVNRRSGCRNPEAEGFKFREAKFERVNVLLTQAEEPHIGGDLSNYKNWTSWDNKHSHPESSAHNNNQILCFHYFEGINVLETQELNIISEQHISSFTVEFV